MDRTRLFWQSFARSALPRWPENRLLIVYVAIGAFVLGFNDWLILGPFKEPGAPYNPIVFVFALIGSAAAVYTNVLAQKAFALRHGLTVTSELSPIKIAAGLLIGPFTAGFVPLIFVPDLEAKIHPYKRLGAWPPSINLKDYAKMGAAGVFANLLLAAIVALAWGRTNPIATALIAANAFAAIAQTLPIPRAPGFYYLYSGVAYGAILFGFSLLGIFLLALESFAAALGLTIASAIVIWLFIVITDKQIYLPR